MKKRTLIPLAMAAALVFASLAAVPQAYAVEDLSVKAIDTYKADKESDYEISFTLEEDLDSGDEIIITFDDAFGIDSKISKNDVKVNGKTVKDVELDDNELKITLHTRYDAGDELEVTIRGAITNPDEADSYEIKVSTENERAARKKVQIEDHKADSDFAVRLSDTTAGARSSYSFEADFGSKMLAPNGQVIIEFPSAEMLPGILTASEFTINGQTVQKVSASGKEVYLTAPGSLTKDSKVKVNISLAAWITNPKTAGSYKLKMTVDGRTISSRPFAIDPPSATAAQPVQPQNVANNSTAIISLGTTEPGQATGVTVSIKALGAPLAKQRDFIELVFPTAFRVPPYIAPEHVTVNGATADYVAVRGQNVLVYPSQDIPVSAATNVVIGSGANIVTPTVKNTYSISVYTSEEKGLLFARAVGIGMPTPVQTAPVIIAPAPATIEPPATQQPAGVPAHAALFKLNTASFTKNGQTSPLQVAPYLYNDSTTMVPVQFFKDALDLTTTWDTQSVVIISGTKVLRFTVGSDQARFGSEEKTLAAPVVLKDGMPMIPLRFVTDMLGYKVGWDEKTSSVYVHR